MNVTASIQLCTGVGPLTPPARFRIWKAGDNPGDYGALRFTKAAADRVMAAYNGRGVALVIDIEHNTNGRVNPTIDPNNPPQTGGYLALEACDTPDGPELWAVPQWSDCGRDHAVPGVVCCARHQIETGQRRYMSPDFDVDPDTREPIRLNRVGLVAEPGTHGIPMLASASANRRAVMDEKQIRAAYALAKMQAETAEGPLKDAANAYVEQLKAAAANMGVDLDADPAPESTPEPATAAGCEPATAAGCDPPAANPATAPAAQPAKEPTNATASRASASGAPLTVADVQRLMAEQRERDAMLADPRLTKEMRNVVASADLAMARSIMKAIPVSATPTRAAIEAGGPVNHVAGAGLDDGPMNEAEKFAVDRIRRALGQRQENITAARKTMSGDPDGALSVSIGDLVAKHKALRNPTPNAIRFGN